MNTIITYLKYKGSKYIRFEDLLAALTESRNEEDTLQGKALMQAEIDSWIEWASED